MSRLILCSLFGTLLLSGAGTSCAGGEGSVEEDQNLDSDSDGLTDRLEAELGTNPQLADTDDDGYPDSDEVEAFTDPLSATDHPYTGGWPIGSCRNNVVPTGNEEGQIAEDFALPDQNGDLVRLHSFCDRAILLVGSAFW